MKTWSRFRFRPLILQYRFLWTSFHRLLSRCMWTDGRTDEHKAIWSRNAHVLTVPLHNYSYLVRILTRVASAVIVSFCGCLWTLQGRYPPSSFSVISLQMHHLFMYLWQWIMNCRGHGRKFSWPASGCCNTGFLQGLRNATKASGCWCKCEVTLRGNRLA